MRIAGLPDLRTRSANARSAGVDPARASIRNITASATAIAAAVCSCMRPVRLWGAASSRPAVSMAVKVRSPSRACASRRSRVTPGRSSTSARRLPTRRLNSVDLPTFGRPTMATVKLMTRAARYGLRSIARRDWGAQSAGCGRIGPGDAARAAGGLRRAGPGARRRLLLRPGRIRPLRLGLRLRLRRPNGDGGRRRFLFRLSHDFGFRLGFCLRLKLGLGWRGLCGRLSLLRLLGSLVALDQFVRHALGHTGRPFREHRLALAREPLLGIKKIAVQDAGRIETLATRQAEAERQREDDQTSARTATHARPPQLPLAPAPSAISISTRERVAAGVCASVMIMSNQRLAAPVSPARQAASTRNSRAV